MPDMPVPGYQTFMRPLVEILSDGQEHVVRDTMAQLADRFRLSPEDRQELIPSGSTRVLDNRVGWAKTYLLKAGLLEPTRRGVVRITDGGRQALATNSTIDNRFLRQFPSFVDFTRGSATSEVPDRPPGTTAPPPPASDTTPRS